MVHIRLYYQNMRGMRTKTDETFHNILLNEYDIIALSETWLKDSYKNNELCDNRYDIFRCDREEVDNLNRRGGGVMLAINKRMEAKAIHIEGGHECVCAEIKFGASEKVTIICVYISPDTQREKRGNLYKAIANLANNSKNKTILIGDFNHPEIEWHRGATPLARGGKDSDLIDMMNITGMEQMNYILNITNKLLDLIFTDIDNGRCIIEECENPIVAIDEYHPALVMGISTTRGHKAKRVKEGGKKGFDFRAGDYMNLYKEFNECKWESVLKQTDINNAVNELYIVIEEIFEGNIQKRKNADYRSREFPIWVSRGTRNILREKFIARMVWKKSGEVSDKDKFNALRKEASKMLGTDRKNWKEELERELMCNPKRFFSEFGHKEKYGLPNEITNSKGVNIKGEEIAVEFVKCFSAVGEEWKNGNTRNCGENEWNIGSALNSEDLLTRQSEMNEDEIDKEKFNEIAIIKEIRKLKNTKAMGVDGIPMFILKGCANSFAIPLKHICNLMIKSGKYPDRWKQTKTVPVFKGKGNRRIVNNYRPITLVSNISKVVEALIYEVIYNEIKGKIVKEQHGFMVGRSTTTNLLSFGQHVTTHMSEGWQTDVFFSDLSKAFDRVDHKRLIYKLRKIGLCNTMIKIIENFLKGRATEVNAGGQRAKSYKIVCGIPQGSKLGGLLFIIFMNDITEILEIQSAIFADDVKIWRVIRMSGDCGELQRGINKLIKWSNDNGLALNEEKCYVMSIGRMKDKICWVYKMGKNNVKRVNEMKDLGVIIDEEWNFRKHIEVMVNRAMKLVGFIWRNTRDFTNWNTSLRIFNVIVRPVLEYASVIWDPFQKGRSRSIEGAQTRLLQSIFYRHKGMGGYDFITYYYSSERLREIYEVETLEVRRKRAMMKIFFKIIKGEVECGNVLEKIKWHNEGINLRANRAFQVNKGNMAEYIKNEPANRFMSLCNEIGMGREAFDKTEKEFMREFSRLMNV